MLSAGQRLRSSSKHLGALKHSGNLQHDGHKNFQNFTFFKDEIYHFFYSCLFGSTAPK